MTSNKSMFRSILLIGWCVTVCAGCSYLFANKLRSDTSTLPLEGTIDHTNSVAKHIKFHSFAQLPTGEIWIVPTLGGYVIHIDKDGNNQFFYHDAIRLLSQIYFRTESDGWMVNEDNGRGLVWRTHDGGKSWSLISKLTAYTTDDLFSQATQVFFSDDLHGWVVDHYNVWKTEDGGTTWIFVLESGYNLMKGQFTNAGFLSSSQVVLTSTDGELLYTHNNGKTWTINNICDLTAAVSQSSSQKAWLLCTEGKIYNTAEVGQNWRLFGSFEQSDTIFDSLHFTDENNGWVIGRKVVRDNNLSHDVPKSHLEVFAFHVVNNGKDRKPIHLPDEVTNISFLSFGNDNNGVLVSNEFIYITKDGGKIWRTLRNEP